MKHSRDSDVNDPRAQAERVLDGLKGFQRRTARYVFKRMYSDRDPATRFLVADEVGLGKTWVARAIIAQAVAHLWDRRDRIDIVYVCSNAAIAQQNLNRLRVEGVGDFSRAERLTLLPMHAGDLMRRRVNLVAFTPGTSFDLASRGGVGEERVLLYHLLRGQLGLRETPLRNLLQLGLDKGRWRSALKGRPPDYDARLAKAFLREIRRRPALRRGAADACDRFRRYRKNIPPEDKDLRMRVVGELRRVLADVCIDALRPALVILDEFQRFKHLLEGEDEAALLARGLWDYPNARVLLLSATPYRMLTLDDDEEDDHYTDFVRTLQFLFGDDETQTEALQRDLRRYRTALYSLTAPGFDRPAAVSAAEAVERRLRRVMVRTERLHSTADASAMLDEHAVTAMPQADDLLQARAFDAVSQCLEVGSTVEYWKSAPYVLNFMTKDYHVKRQVQKLQDRRREPPAELSAALADWGRHGLNEAAIRRYAELDPANARLRRLLGETLGMEQWRVLWVPPSMPYMAPGGAYREVGPFTKSLLFSCWKVVPDAVAALVSYEAERRMMAGGHGDYREVSDHATQLLRFRLQDGKPASMANLTLIYPCVALATAVDPLRLALEASADGPASVARVEAAAEKVIKTQLRATGRWPTATRGREDERWYWAALALLDAPYGEGIANWCKRSDGWSDESTDAEDKHSGGFRRHVEEFRKAPDPGFELGRAPRDLVSVLAEIALASPAVCALRALRRVCGVLDCTDFGLLDAAAQTAEGIRSLLNLPETIALLRAEDDGLPYWRRVLRHGIEGNLQATLDEYFHCLRESLGVVEHEPAEAARQIAAAAVDALSIRTSHLDVDEIRVGSNGVDVRPFGIRCRYALRYGELRGEHENTLTRAKTVRRAFNSPFRPFLLATTSIGQEGLDFHTYCHRVYHWNLPSNPVDLEQREGRVQRYKGHAVRRNLAMALGLRALRGTWKGGDPWEQLFDLAAGHGSADGSDLVPYWIYEVEGGVRVERRVPMLPFSREEARLRRLKRGLAIYRLAFGQPRQEDLLAYLDTVADGGQVSALNEKCRIRLGPP